MRACPALLLIGSAVCEQVSQLKQMTKSIGDFVAQDNRLLDDMVRALEQRAQAQAQPGCGARRRPGPSSRHALPLRALAALPAVRRAATLTRRAACSAAR